MTLSEYVERHCNTTKECTDCHKSYIWTVNDVWTSDHGSHPSAWVYCPHCGDNNIVIGGWRVAPECVLKSIPRRNVYAEIFFYDVREWWRRVSGHYRFDDEDDNVETIDEEEWEEILEEEGVN